MNESKESRNTSNPENLKIQAKKNLEKLES